ncbi:MAG: ABC transporter ATP-binding protein [Saprospiraceae bacterium]|jgi:ABC-type multidrug transport system ATPase subunit
MMETIVDINQLSKSFGSLKAVDGLDLKVAPREVFGLLGPNGAGKSTTLRMLLSLIRPDSGSIKVFGLDLGTERRRVLQQIGCIIEKPDFYLYMSGLDNLRVFGALSHTPRLRARIDEMLELVGLKGRERDLVKTYSHGMKQRLGLAQALLHDPTLIILDEPTTGLDPQGIIELRNLILRLKNDLNKTVILSSHILSEIEMIADRMAIINNGKAVVQGRVRELLTEASLNMRIQTDDVPRALDVLRAISFQGTGEDSDGGRIALECVREDVPRIVHALCAAGVGIFGVQATRGLEDFFLRITAASENSVRNIH